MFFQSQVLTCEKCDHFVADSSPPSSQAAFITEVLGADRVVVRGDDIDKEIKGWALRNGGGPIKLQLELK